LDVCFGRVRFAGGGLRAVAWPLERARPRAAARCLPAAVEAPFAAERAIDGYFAVEPA
jgi:hypothetical protein